MVKFVPIWAVMVAESYGGPTYFATVVGVGVGAVAGLTVRARRVSRTGGLGVVGLTEGQIPLGRGSLKRKLREVSINRTIRGHVVLLDIHDDVIKWKHFPRYWSFVRGIHRSPVNSLHKRPVMRSFDVYFDLCPNTWLSTAMEKLVIWDAISLIMTSL